MSVRPEFRDYVLDQLTRVVPVTSRAMFGGVGIYSEGIFFALMDDDLLYFKVDDTNRADFERAGKGPFQPFGVESKPMGYYEVPGEVLENADELRTWVARALDVARRAKRPKR